MAEGKDLADVQERSAEQIQRDIAVKREALSETVDRLETRIQKKLDWREWVAQNPYLAVATAAGCGLMFSWILRARVRRSASKQKPSEMPQFR